MTASSASAHNANVCAMCLESISDPNRKKTSLACYCVFHEDCLKELEKFNDRRNLRCPLCRRDRWDVEIAAWKSGHAIDSQLMLKRARMIITKDAFVLLVQERNHSWNLPGGRVEKCDCIKTRHSWNLHGGRVDSFKCLEACARREVHEETGIFPTGQLTKFDIVDKQALYQWNADALSWDNIQWLWMHCRKNTTRHPEILNIWWAPMDSTLYAHQLTHICCMALSMMMSANDF